MNALSSSTEQDAGTLYPTMMEDSNGNQIAINYWQGIGLPLNQTNSSSRIKYIYDARRCVYGTQGCWDNNPTYEFAYDYNSGPIPHLVSIVNSVGTSESFGFTMANQMLVSPIDFVTPFGNVAVLQATTVTGLGVGHQFQYNGAGELTQVTTPLGGVLGWAYGLYHYSSPYDFGRNYREAQSRYLRQSSGGTQYTWTISRDNGAYIHGSATLADAGAGTQKVWTFDTSGGPTNAFGTAYEEHDASGATLLRKEYTWAQEGFGSPNPYISGIVTKLNPGAPGSVRTMTGQALDAHGNLAAAIVYDYPNASTLTRTYNYSYLANGNYTSRYIYNRLTSATVTPAGGGATTLVTNYYDGSSSTSCPAITASQATTMHDAAYDQNFSYRGNVTQTVGLTSGNTSCYAYDSAGVAQETIDGMGHKVTVSADSTTNYSLPTLVTPNDSSAMATSMTYASSFAVTSVTGPNGAQGTTTYDVYGRPASTVIPDGATTTYSYAYSPPTQTATVNGRWKQTTLDGFGRVIEVDTGHDSVTLTNTVSRALTQYAPCACSPLLKVWRVSQPFNPNTGSPVWTTYTYDGSGRTTAVTAPDGASTTQTSYSGNNTTVTDAAGKWKTSTVDAFGNLTLVTEPNPAGGSNWTTSYTYSVLNQLTQVSMTRPQGTQTRTFSYTGADLTSATNPENGTVTYAYDNAHHVTSRTDARGAVTQYSYDAYGRATEVRHGAMQDGSFTEDLKQRVDYTYDSGTNGQGRLTGVTFGNGDVCISTVWPYNHYSTQYQYEYQYNSAGRVTSQSMALQGPPGCLNGAPPPINLTATYQWDTEGRMTAVGYPTYQNQGGPVQGGGTYGYQYDNVGRLNLATFDNGGGPQTAATATYGPAGELLSLVQGSYLSETRTYNNLLQVTRMTATAYGQAVMDMQYNYSATQNNGRIVGSNDYVTGENVSYSYDALNRLSAASAGSLWGEAYTYDGFGNLTQKMPTQSPAPAMSATYDTGNHQLGLLYDASGNQLEDPLQTVVYGWDGENRMVSQATLMFPSSTTAYTYDAWGKRVEVHSKPAGADETWEFDFYGVTGQKLVALTCDTDASAGTTSCWLGGIGYFGGKRLGVATDRLGSVRWSGGTSMSYFPYGEERTVTTDGGWKFATYTRDGVGQDYAEQRYYNNGTGRFWSPDPSMGVSFGDPMTWNKYAYVGGDPVNFRDRHGTCRMSAEGDDENGDAPPQDVCVIINDSTGPTHASPETDLGDTGEPIFGSNSMFPKCNPSNDGTEEADLQFIATNYSAALSLSQQSGVSVTWLLAWAASESGWGGSSIATANGNYVNESLPPGGVTGGWLNAIACPSGAVAGWACFGSFSDSVYSALYTQHTTWTYPGQTTPSGLSVITAFMAANPNPTEAQVFQAVADAGFDPSGTTTNSGYGGRVAGVAITKRLNCLQSNNYLK